MTKPRKLSRFLCREMLYDYVTGYLNEERKQAVEEYLSSSSDEREELERLKAAIKYCDDLGGTTVSHPLMDEILEEQAPMSKNLEQLSWRHWPEFLRWGTEALLISLVVATLAILTPWDRVQNWLPQNKRPLILAEVEKPKVEEPKEEAPESSTPPEKEQAASETPPKTKEAKETVASHTESKAGDEDLSSEPPPVLMSKQTGKEEAEPVEAKPKEKTKTAQVKVKEGAEEKTLKGVLYRGKMSIENLDVNTPLMVAEIEKLGGEKAGQVELGWRNKPSESYFHFSMPEANYEELVKNLRYFGPVQISKEPHWRVMPEGKIRIILVVEEAKK